MLNRLALFVVLSLITSNLLAGTEERTIHQTFALNAGGRVELSNVNGDVTITGWDKNQVDMKATKRGPSQNLDLVEIRTNSTPERLTIETKYPHLKRNTDVSVSYVLMVPKSAILDSIDNVNGGISVSGVENEIRMNTVNGTAEIQGSKASLDAGTVNGRIDVTWTDFPRNGNIKLQTVNGSLKLRLPQNINADVHAESLNGSIETEFPMTVSGRFISRKLSGKIGQGGTSINLSTVNGSIDILKAQR
jgi:DUF4097 and DUF4098 domain-containing protein YvlB